MTISSTTVKNSYSGNGTLDTFNYTFKIFADADIQVIIRDASATETVKTLTTHYTVTGAGSALVELLYSQQVTFQVLQRQL